MRTLVLLFLTVSPLMAQEVIEDTVYISKNRMSHLVFGEAIVHSDYGSGVVSSDNGVPVVTEVNQKPMLLIKARKRFREPTNISIITASDRYYNIVCLYAEEPKRNYYFFDFPKQETETESLTSVMSKDPDGEDQEVFSARAKDSILEREQQLFYTDTVRYKGVAKWLYADRGKRIRRIHASNGQVTLSLIGCYARKDKLYLKFSVFNGGTLPYHFGHWDFHYGNREGHHRQTTSEQSVRPIYTYNERFQSVIPNSEQVKVFVFDQFAINEQKQFYVDVVERSGTRNLALDFSSKYINGAKVIPAKYLEKEQLESLKPKRP